MLAISISIVAVLLAANAMGLSIAAYFRKFPDELQLRRLIVKSGCDSVSIEPYRVEVVREGVGVALMTLESGFPVIGGSVNGTEFRLACEHNGLPSLLLKSNDGHFCATSDALAVVGPRSRIFLTDTAICGPHGLQAEPTPMKIVPAESVPAAPRQPRLEKLRPADCQLKTFEPEPDEDEA